MRALLVVVLSLLASMIVLPASEPTGAVRTSSAQDLIPRPVPPPLPTALEQALASDPREGTRQVAGPSGEVADATGDAHELVLLYPYPNLGRDLTMDGGTITVLVPDPLIYSPLSLYWYGGASQPSADWAWLDVAPDGSTEMWSLGSPAQTDDPTNPSLAPHEDVTRLRVSQADARHMKFEWQLRGPVPSGKPDVNYYFGLGSSPEAGLHDPVDWWVRVYPLRADEWIWALKANGSSFYWRSTAYEDIVSSRVVYLGAGQLRVEMTLASPVPAKPAERDAEPWFIWYFDLDDNRATGDDGTDMDVVVRYNASTEEWEGAVRRYNGEKFEDIPGASVSITRAGSRVSADVTVSDLGLAQTFSWCSETIVYVSNYNEPFAGEVDEAPDDGWVKMGLTRVYLPLVVWATDGSDD